MKHISFRIFYVIASAQLFTLLFLEKSLGLNLLIFEGLFISVACFLFKPKVTSILSKSLLLGTLISLIMVVYHNTQIAKFINVVSFLLLLGSLPSSNYKLIKSFIQQFFHSLFNGVKEFFDELFNSKKRKIRLISYLKIIGIPLFLILFFFIIYYNSNEYFATLIEKFFKKIEVFLNWIPSVNIYTFITFIVGLTLGILLFYQTINSKFSKKEALLTDNMKRRRFPLKSNNFLALKSEYKSGIFLLASLNLLLLIFNYSDITTVWFSYTWDGGYLKSFVHQGTYLLIVSLLVSICIALYYFRGNLNFYTKNKWLKLLTYIWLGQNLLLIISLFIRNSIYIHHFALAYKRIGVYAFLIATIIVIITILIKVKSKKSAFYITKHNTLSVYFILLILCCVNWDVVIAKYNLNSYDKSFIELSFLSELSNKALPYVNLNHEKLNNLETQQAESFSFSSRSYYMNKTTYKEKIENKIRYFVDSYPNRSWLEWNYADYSAYKKLTSK